MGKISCNFISYSLKRTVDITVVVPTPTLTDGFTLEAGPSAPVSHKPPHKYPVLYLLHGMGNNHATWSGYSNVEMYAEERNIIVVMFSAENKNYQDVPGINGMLKDNFFRFLHKELPDFVCGMFPALSKPEHTYIAGLSMGGYGTLVHGFTNPEQYRAMGALSIGGNPPPRKDAEGNDIPYPDSWKPIKLAEKVKAEGRQFPKMYIACGDKDGLYPAALELQEKMKELGADVTWVPCPGFVHEWRLWDQQIEAFLDWIPRTDFYAGSKRRI
ncbi:alpha/beta hydrolase [Acutalibacter caecimuris]|uniref:alpha/beta hydrolase n=1 Tax=Acutalibacter caecimuris TaxID=3093657 RepID=UPI002AC97591|nr:alpha/beta hydrolase family protein [Acutalibacter sp. M00118]